jgi:hypothetical protein
MVFKGRCREITRGAKELILAPWKGFEFVEYGSCVGILMSCIKKMLANKKNWYKKKFNWREEDEAWWASDKTLTPSSMARRGFSWKRTWYCTKFSIMKKFSKIFANRFVSLFFLFHKTLFQRNY